MNCLIIVSYQATSWRESHTLVTHIDTQGCLVPNYHKIKCSRSVARISLILFSLFAWSCCCKLHRCRQITGRGQFIRWAEEEKLHFPPVVPAQWNPGIVLVTAGFQSTLKCNWTRVRQTEKERHFQGQSLAWHAIATSVPIDLYKATLTPRHSVLLI